MHIPTPAPNAPFTGANPEVMGHSGWHAAHSHTVLIDGLHGLVDHAVGVESHPSEKWGLSPKIVAALSTVMHTDGDVEQDRMLKVHINTRAFGCTEKNAGRRQRSHGTSETISWTSRMR
jgi:hypothetical protein